MYYILNETHQVIAADDNFLTYCDVTHINELSTKIAKGDIELAIGQDKTVTLTLPSKEEVFSVDKVALSSLLGQLTLISIAADITDDATPSITSAPEDEPNELIDSIINDTVNTDEVEDFTLDDSSLDDIEINTPNVHSEEEEITFGDHLNLDDILDNEAISLNESPTKEDSEDESDKSPSTLDLPNDDELFDLVLDDEKEIEIADSLDLGDTTMNFDLPDENDTAITLNEAEEDVSEIYIDSHTISQKIGISNDDYKNFLNDFIDTALSLEKDLQSSEVHTRNDAITTLSHLSDVLHLPVVSDILSNIKDKGTQREDIASLYNTLSRITTQENGTEQNSPLAIEETPIEQNSHDESNEKLELFDAPTPEPMIQESVAPRNVPKGESFGTISLEGIKPKHFDFQLEEAANDLSLPIELIEEFVNDFIEQAHIETKKMLQAYEDGDLDAIHKIGHLLKGASSNLRINPLSDTLYKIQFCEKSDDLEILIKDYWAHFLSFETQINAISH